ncbi:hypothetical protein E0485_20855 [Paenibacillus albiflavus]|uniref:Uncharacterized protein n=1 Tax=Paenibacillus albiflavus TaxID=2545760 RepID=A0A4R4E2D3_9BACL|nr:hypothetical protein [Paenibacillus albiflavus]TCZ73559.1 hypothetical protein E0485_20855 [Paenibacillus albiflavus]
MKAESEDQFPAQVNMKSKELLHLLAPVQRRLRLFEILRCLYWGIIGGSAAALVWLIMGRFIPVPYLYEVAGITILAGALSGVIGGIARRIPHSQSAHIIDSADKSNAVITALHYIQDESPIVQLQREQAIEVANRFGTDIRSNMPLPSQRKPFIVGCLCLAIVVALALIPNPMDEMRTKQEQIRNLVQEQQMKIEELKQLLEAKELPTATREVAKQSIERLEERLKDSKSIDQALENMEKSMKEMQALANDLKKEQAKAEQMLRDLEKQSMLAQVAKSMRQGDPNQLQQAMNELKQNVNKLSPEAKEALAKQLEQFAQQMPQDGKAESDALRKALEAAAAAAKQDGDASELQDKLAELDKQLAEALAKMGASKQALAALQAQQAQLGELGEQLAKQGSAAGLAVAKGWSAAQASADGLDAAGGGDAADNAAWDEAAAKAQGAGNGNASGNGSGAGAASGNGAGSGQGTGIGAGQGGSGAGVGVGDRNLVMTPRKYEGTGDIYKDNGPNSGKGGEVQKGGTSPMVDGVSRPYEEVYNQYAAEAKDALNRAPLPERMQGLVEQYFLEIQPNP